MNILRKRKILWVSLIALFAAAITLAVHFFHGSSGGDIEANESAVRVALKQLCSAEAEFRSMDQDQNHINDFWTGDVASLHTLDVGAGPINLIERDLALADAAPLKPLAGKPIPFHGYYFVAMERDESDCIFPGEIYKQDTDGKMGRVHNTGTFAFSAFPAAYGKTGQRTFVIVGGYNLGTYDTNGKPVLRIPCEQKPPHVHGKRAPYDCRQ